MKEQLLVNEIKKILSENPQFKARYSGELEWFETWQSLWKTDKIRVGVIGVTSSGKSTIINALLGDNLLSVAVRPSSSQLVSCSYAKERSATVYFLNGEKKHLKDTPKLKDLILQYSDELYNQKNQKQVAQLELSTPHFDLGEDILLVDSPGLDATGYEIHEKLTLENLLPTVDVVIFVTTVKSEIDRKMKNTLNIIAKYHCPVMIVQNMLDSVRPSIDGKKSASEVAQERMNRVLLAVEQSNLDDKNEIKVTQISAINAMKYRCQESHTKEEVKNYKFSRYEDFVSGIKELIDFKRPEIEQQRINTITEHVSELIRQEDNKFGSVTGTEIIDTSLDSLEKGIINSLNNTLSDLNRVIKEIERIDDNYFSTNESNYKNANNMFSGFFQMRTDSKEKSFSEQDIQNIKNTIKEFEEKVSKSILAFKKDCTSTINKLNLPSRDLWSYNGLPRMPEMEVKKKTVSKTRTVKKEGFGHSLLRFVTFGIYKGETTETYTETVQDDEATRESVKRYLERVKFEYGKTINNWHTNAEATVVSITKEIGLRKKAIEERQKQVLEAAEWKKLKRVLEKTLKKYSVAKTKHKKKEESFGKEEHVAEADLRLSVPAKILKIHNFATEYVHALHKTTLEVVQKKIGYNDYPTIVFSNSADNIIEFLYRFYNIQKDTIMPGETQRISSKLTISCLPGQSQINNILNQAEKANIVILINGLQFHTDFSTGFRKSVLKNIEKNCAVYFVIQDFEALANGNAITESIRSVYLECSEIGKNSLVLLSHENPVYNMAIIHGQITGSNLSDETELQDALSKKFPMLVDAKTKKHVSDILRSFVKKEDDTNAKR